MSESTEREWERGELGAGVIAVLRRGSRTKADILLVRRRSREVVVKDFAGRRFLVRRFLGPWLLDREERAYRALEGCTFMPRLIERLDSQAIVLEYRPGACLSRSLRGRLPADFLTVLREAVYTMHRRGVVHLDLRHRSNVLAGEDGEPVILDFATALLLPGDRGPRCWLRGLFEVIDRRALRKWQRKIAPSG